LRKFVWSLAAPWSGNMLVLAVAFLAAGVGAPVSGQSMQLPAPPARTYLHYGWQLQSSCAAKDGAEKISQAGFDASSWHKAEIPSTVVGALVTDKTYPDPDYAMNLRSFPGMNYGDKSFFALQDMPKDSPFRCSWWFRTEFVPTNSTGHANTFLHFMGINYRANIWMNGKKIAGEKEVAGTYRTFEFDVTKYLQPGKTNALALEISAPGKDDLGITWVDWNPTPPD
jgi:exo-1,4-beta-D-glucosaminidase